jgi:diguanylate cyclase (GGDEF)-like protein
LTETQGSKTKSPRLNLIKVIGLVASPDLLLWLASAGAAVSLLICGLCSDPTSVDWLSAANRIPLLLLFLLLALVSCLFPARGLMFGQRVRLTPLVAIVAAMVLPPPLTTVPIIIAAAVRLASVRDSSSRRETLGSIIILVFAQLTANLVLQSSKQIPEQVKNGDFLQATLFALKAVVVFSFLYLTGIAVVAVLPRLIKHFRGSPPTIDQDWRINWSNEAWVCLLGSPFAIALSFALALSEGILMDASVVIVIITVFAFLAHVLVDRRIQARQILALQRLTKSTSLGEANDEIRLLKELSTHCQGLVWCDRSIIWLYNDQDLKFDAYFDGRHAKNDTLPSRSPFCHAGEDLVGLVVKRKHPILVKDARREGRHPYYSLSTSQKNSLGPVSVLLMPLLDASEVIGVIELECRGWNVYRPSDARRLESLMALAAMSLSNQRLHRVILHQAATDGLTGVYNKRHALQLLNDEIRRADRYGHPLAIMMLDIDYFKNYNDTYGHVQGDVLLQQFAEVVKTTVRSTDTVGRFGGEEFFVIMPETTREAALASAERIRQAVEAAEFPGSRDTAETVSKTVSIGVAALVVDALETQSLVAAADEALYRAKRDGRNQVADAQPIAELLKKPVAGLEEAWFKTAGALAAESYHN